MIAALKADLGLGPVPEIARAPGAEAGVALPPRRLAPKRRRRRSTSSLLGPGRRVNATANVHRARRRSARGRGSRSAATASRVALRTIGKGKTTDLDRPARTSGLPTAGRRSRARARPGGRTRSSFSSRFRAPKKDLDASCRRARRARPRGSRGRRRSVSIAASVPPGMPVSITIASGRSVEQLPNRLLPRVPARVAHDEDERRPSAGASAGAASRGAVVEPDAARARPELGEAVRELAGGDVRRRNELDDERVALERRRCRARGARGARRRHRPRGPGRTVGRRTDAQRGDGGHPRRRLLEPLERQPAGPRRPRRARRRSRRPSPRAGRARRRARRRRPRARARRLLDADAAADRAHLERVGDHEPVEAELVAQQPGQRSARLSVAGTSSSAGTSRCAVMTACTPAAIAARNGSSAASRSPADDRAGRGASRPRCRRARGSAWRRRRRPAAASLDERRDVAGDELGVGAEAADADHRVVGIRVHVGDGREVEVDAGAGEVGRDRGGDLLRQRDVVDGAEREVARVGAAAAASSRVTSPPSSSIASEERRPPRAAARSASASCSGSRTL